MLGTLKYDILLPAVTARVTTASGSAVDLSGYANNNRTEFVAILDVGTITGTQGTLDVTVEECATTNGTYTAIATFAQVTTTTGGQAKHFATTKQYVRATGTTGGTSPSYVYAVHIVGVARVA